MKRLTVLSVLLALGFVIGLHGATVTVGTVAEPASFFPVHTGYSYNYTQQIYTQPQINHAGEISRLRFYHHGSYSGSLDNSHDWVIYLGHTGRDSFTSTADWEPTANLVQVFSGSVLNNFPPQGEWMEIILDTPFNYDNVNNLIVAVHESTLGLNYGVHWGSFSSGSNTGLSLPHNSINPDVNDLPNARLLTDNIASIQLVFPDTEIPLPPTLVSPTDNAYVTNGQALEWSLPAGSADASSYDVYIDGSLVSENQTARSYLLTDLEAGHHTWQVVARNNVGSSNPSETRTFVMSLAIGDGDASFGLPIELHSSFNQSQTIYLQSEIGSGTQGARIIEKIAYYWNGAATAANSDDWIIYLGHTDRTEFANNGDWVHIGQMVKVFDGHIDIEATPGWVEIELDIPFVYNNTDNLVVAVYEISLYFDECETPSYFYSTATPDQNRSIHASHYDYYPAPNQPSFGRLKPAYPNILIWFAQTADTPVLSLTPSALDFGIVMNGSSAGPLLVRASNAGAGTLNLSPGDVSIIGPNTSEFSFDPLNLPAALAGGQHVYIPVSVTGASAGEISATLRIVYNGQNHDVPLAAEVLSTGTITIGDGTHTQFHPFYAHSTWLGSAALYTADQINATGSIDMFAWDCSRISTIAIPYKIWAKNTTDTAMSRMNWNEMQADMTLLKEGTLTPNTLGWQVFQFDTPFAYTGGNLYVAVETTYGPTWCDQENRYRYTTGASNHQYWYGTYTSHLSEAVPNIMMHFSSGLQNDISALSISGSSAPTLGETSSYTVRIKNYGSDTQSNYQVKLMGPNNTVLAFVDGPPIGSLQTLDVPVPWSPATLGPLTIYGKVELSGDELAQNDHTGIIPVEVQPSGTQAITIGAGDELAGYPLVPNTRNSIYQTLYLADELGFGCGTINSMLFYNSFTWNRYGAAKIYLGSTDQIDLNAGFIPSSQLTLVFDGQISYPAGENTILIHFQAPYVYTGGNLVMLFHRTLGSGGSGRDDFFRCQTIGNNRSRYAAEEFEIYPFDPPEGTLTGQFPQTTFLYTLGSIENDLGTLDITGNTNPTVGNVSEYTVRLRNHGSAAQGNYSVKIMGAGGMELAGIAGPTIAPQQTLQVTIPWTPTTAGPISIYGKVELAGDELPQNNQTSPLLMNVNPESMQSVTLGAGDELALFPMDFYRKCSLCETLYKDEELGFVSGTITSMALYNNFYSHLRGKLTRIYLGSTDREDMSAGYIPATELTLVFDGHIDYPSGENTILIHFQTPYVHTGGNLVMLFSRPMDKVYYTSLDLFKCQSGGRSRTVYSYTDYVDLSPEDPPTGSLTHLYPQATFFFNADQIQNDLVADSIRGNPSPSVGTASLYTVKIRNFGIETQSNYTVKLMGPENVELTSVAGPHIDGLQTLEVTLPWTPTNSGNYAIYGKIDLDGDEHPDNNRTADYDVMVYPADVFAVTVGDGSQDYPYPVNMFWERTLFQTLYYPDELDGFAGYITGIKFFNNFESNMQNIPVSIWLGTTIQADLTGGYIPSTQLTPVFDGLVNLPSGQNVIDITLDQPFMYTQGNLVMLIFKSVDFFYWSRNLFRCQNQGSNRSLYSYTGYYGEIYPSSPPQGELSAIFPQTTFMVIPGELGQVSGTVTTADGQPIENAEVSINDGLFRTTTNDAGEYEFSHVLILPQTYTISFTAYGYYDHSQSFELEADEQLVINASLQPLPQVNVSGTVFASDTLAEIQGAVIKLSGYGTHEASTDAQGHFNIANVYAHHSYNYRISAVGYSPKMGQIDLSDSDYDLGDIILEESAYMPIDVTATLNLADDTVEISWLAPNPEAQEVNESFESDTFPPANWSQIITNGGIPEEPDIIPTWHRVGPTTVDGFVVNPTDGSFQAGLQRNIGSQNEWLITPEFECPPNAFLGFDSYVYFGSIFGDHYYVKVSPDNGSNWTVLWDASEHTGGWNRYGQPITVNLGAYSGNRIKIAFHALGSDDFFSINYPWYIDNIYIGNGRTTVKLNLDELSTAAAGTVKTCISKDKPAVKAIRRDRGEIRSRTRAFIGYMVYRLRTGQEQYEGTWIAVTPEPTTALNANDSDWSTLPNAHYRWAVKSIYTNNVTSVASFSNILHKNVPSGTVLGTVRSKDNTAIINATITNGTVSTTTNSMGAYSLTLPTGSHTLTASAPGYWDQTIEDVIVELDQFTTLNFVMVDTSNDESEIPVLVTALNGNYPNPFNPETTISYSVKEPGRVKLEVYNIKGQLVRTLVDEDHASGHYKKVFNSKDNRGRSISSGVYLIRMSAPGYQKTSKMILMQ